MKILQYNICFSWLIAGVAMDHLQIPCAKLVHAKNPDRLAPAVYLRRYAVLCNRGINEK